MFDIAIPVWVVGVCEGDYESGVHVLIWSHHRLELGIQYWKESRGLGSRSNVYRTEVIVGKEDEDISALSLDFQVNLTIMFDLELRLATAFPFATFPFAINAPDPV